MWPDNETTRDFLNFSGVADTVAEIIIQARGRPISIGVSGAWGIGKSSMIKLTQTSFANRPRKDGERDFVFVEFNAWLYQGYDDARAALMDVIVTKLEAEANARERGIDKAKTLLKRVNWLRAAKLAGTAAPIFFGLPPIGLAGEIWALGQKALEGKLDKDLVGDAKKVAGEATSAAGALLNPKVETSPPKEIQALRDTFEESLEELDITLVVLIDDLDRCLPETTISTLEAIRSFLFLKNTAFVIAADNDMIKHAVRRHFEGIGDDLLVTNYFDKLIQVPIRVPPLGTQEVRAYIMLLFIENSSLEDEVKEKIRVGVCTQLRHTWQGKRVDRAFVQTLHNAFPAELIGKLDTADRLAPLMTTASGIVGNPRLIKRFLNALAIRMAISNAQGVGVDEAVLAKLLLFERLGNPRAYSELISAVSASQAGKPRFLAEWEEKANAGMELALSAPWEDLFVKEWLTLPPELGDVDLRGALYVSREHAPLITPEDRLSSESAELLVALLEHPDMAAGLKDRLTTTPSAWNGTRALAKKSSRIKTALGLHPQLAHQRKSELALFERMLKETRYVGEVGLDGAPDFLPHWADQVVVFDRVLDLCQKAGGRILSIHSRRATSAVLSRLETKRGVGTPIMHWFPGTPRELARATELGCWFSVGPAMLATEKGRALTAKMPRDRVLTETDGPFALVNGKAAVPWDSGGTVLTLEKIWNAPTVAVQHQLLANLRRLTAD